MGIHMKLVDILLNALKGIAANATKCKACEMNNRVAQEALDRFYNKKRDSEQSGQSAH